MLENQINNINIIHWHYYGASFKAYFYISDQIYKLAIILSNEILREVTLFDEFGVRKEALTLLINSYSTDWTEISLNDILNDEDKTMTGTKLFKENIKPLLRNKKINDIIYGQ